MNLDNLKFIKNLTWQQVFLIWEKEETKLNQWTAHYQSRGYSSWEDWRKATIKDFEVPASQLDWKLYEVVDPAKTVSTFSGGPFGSWIGKFYKPIGSRNFGKLAESKLIQEYPKIKEILNNPPSESTLIGLETNEGIVIIEGNHRSCAFALAFNQGITLDIKLYLALAEYKDGPIPIMGEKLSSD